MERVKDEFSCSSPEGMLPWPEDTNGIDCPWQPLLACPQPCLFSRTSFHPSCPPPTDWHPSLASTLSSGWCPVPWAGGALSCSPAALVPAEARRWAPADKTLSCHTPGAPIPFVFKLLGWLPRLHLFSVLKTQLYALPMTNCAILFPKDGLWTK